MPTLLDHTVDLSNIATSYAAIVPSGLTDLVFLGQTLTKTGRNWAPGGNALTFPGQGIPTVNQYGAIVDYFHPVQIESTPTASETLLVASSFVMTGNTFNAELIGNYGAGYGDSINAQFDAANGAFTLAAGMLVGGSQTDVVATIGDSDTTSGMLSGQTITRAVLTQPNLYMIRRDMVNRLLTFANLTQKVAGGSANWYSQVAIPSGDTPVINSARYRLGGYASVSSGANCVQTCSFAAKYSRAITDSEWLAIYNQTKTALGRRGVTI